MLHLQRSKVRPGKGRKKKICDKDPDLHLVANIAYNTQIHSRIDCFFFY